MDSATYRHLLGQLKKSCTIPHYNFPGHNLLSLETLIDVSKDLKEDDPHGEAEFLTDFPCYQPFPYAVQQSTILHCGSCYTDKAAKLVKRKLRWEKELKTLMVPNIDAAIENIKKMREKKAVMLSNNLKNYVEHLHCDPEPMFSGSYNWLYTGGCLSYCQKSNESDLIVGDFVLDKPVICVLQLNKAQDKIMQKSSFQMKSSSPILQIICRSHTENLITCVRQKNYLTIFNATEVDSLTQPVKLWKKKVGVSKLLTCIDLEANCERVITTDSNHDINVFHIESTNKICGYPGRKISSDAEDAWSQIEFGNDGAYWALRNCFVVLDFRDSRVGPKLSYEPSSATNLCEKFSSFAKSQSNSNFVYLSTDHHILQLDLRKGKPVQRWTHLMKHSPQFMAITKDNYCSEVLLLQSPSVDEISGITNEVVNDGGEVNFVSKSLPCVLGNIKDSLNMARLRGTCLSPLIPERLNFSVTGMQCLKNNEGDITLFTTNSGGDVFISKIKSKTSECSLTEENEKEIIQTMKIYESHLEESAFKKPMLNHLELTDMRLMLKSFQHSEKKTARKKKRINYWKSHEKYSFESLKFHKDILAQKILSVWYPNEPMPEEPEGEDLAVEEIQCLKEPLPANDRVQKWLDDAF